MQWRRRNAKSSRNIKKMHLFLFSRGMDKENVADHKKYLQGKNDAIFGWLVGDLFAIWLVCGWCGWLVGALAGLWVVCGWFDWFVGGLDDLWVVWLVCRWFRVLQLTQLLTVYNSLKYTYFCFIVARNRGNDLTEHCRLNCTYSCHKRLKHIRTTLISATS